MTSAQRGLSCFANKRPRQSSARPRPSRPSTKIAHVLQLRHCILPDCAPPAKIRLLRSRPPEAGSWPVRRPSRAQAWRCNATTRAARPNTSASAEICANVMRDAVHPSQKHDTAAACGPSPHPARNIPASCPNPAALPPSGPLVDGLRVNGGGDLRGRLISGVRSPPLPRRRPT